MKSLRMFLISALVVVCASLVSAGPIIAYSNPTGSGTQAYTGSLGMDFTVNSPTGIDIFSVGAFDSGQNGFSRAMTIQFYSLANPGTAVFTTTLSAGTSGTLVGGDRFSTLGTPLYLAPGSYSVVASGFSADDPNGNTFAAAHDYGTLNDGGGLISFIGTSRYGSAGAFPGTADFSKAQYGAATFTYGTPVVQQQDGGTVPEPGSMLLMGGGLALITIFSRRFVR
jgi:hypothetical protein